MTVLAGSVVRCAPDESAPPRLTPASAPTPPGSGQPFLHAQRDSVWLSWVAPVDSTRHALRYAVLNGDTWSDPATAATGRNWFVNWADVPSVRPMPGGRMAAHFLQSSGPDVYAYDVRITQRTDDGTWHTPRTPHDDGTQTEHGFVTLLPHGTDGLRAVWLDGRKMADGGPMTLRAGVLDAAGTVTQTTELDGRTCECCPTTAVRTDSGVLVAYRDRTENEVRNIQTVRYDGQTWSAPSLLHDDGWTIRGCPVNGPALTSDGDRVAAAWFTGADGRPRVQVAFSTNGGRTFGAPTVVDETGPQGYVDAVLLDDGSAIVSWVDVDAADGESALRARHVATDGARGPVRTLVTPLPGGRTGMPRLVRTQDALVAAWVGTDEDGTQRVRVGRLPIASMP
jgi:hypothetical protein